MKHFHPHVARIDFLRKQIEQFTMLLEDYRKSQLQAQERYLRPDTKYTDMRDLAKEMRSCQGKIITLERQIKDSKKELKTLEESQELT